MSVYNPIPTFPSVGQGAVGIDADISNIFTWSFVSDNGEKQTAYQVKIFNISNSLIYDSGVITSINQYHTIPSGVLSNDNYYLYQIITKHNVTFYYSGYVLFQTAYTPTVAVNALPSPFIHQFYTFTATYSSSSGIEPKSSQWFLYDSGDVLLDQSEEVLGTTISYEFTGLENSTTYKIKTVVIDQLNMTAESSLVSFTTDYTIPYAPDTIIIDSDCKSGTNIVDWSNVVAQIGKIVYRFDYVTLGTPHYSAGVWDLGIDIDENYVLKYDLNAPVPKNFTQVGFFKFNDLASKPIVNFYNDGKIRYQFGYDNILKKFYYRRDNRITCGIPIDVESEQWIEVAQNTFEQASIANLVVFNNELYGSTTQNGLLLKLNSSNVWEKVADQFSTVTEIRGLLVYNSEIYGSSYPGGKLLKWNGTNAWVEVAPQFGSEAYVNCILVYNNEIYGCTYPSGNLLKWNGTNAWIQVAPQFGSETSINEIVVYNNKIYGGSYPGGKLLEWNGTNAWVEVAPQFGSEVQIYSLATHGGKLYGGTYPGGILLEWNDINAWSQKTSTLNSQTAITKLISYDGSLFGGTLPSANLFRWDGVSAWEKVADNLNSQTFIRSAVEYNNQIYAGTSPGAFLFKWNQTSAATRWYKFIIYPTYVAYEINGNQYRLE